MSWLLENKGGCGMSDIERVESTPAPEFELVDSEGRMVSLSSYKGNRHVILIFNRGFG